MSFPMLAMKKHSHIALDMEEESKRTRVLTPYLNKGNFKEKLITGMAFALEPGVYLEGKFGVRHEDVFLVEENGAADILTGSRAKGP